MSFKEGDRVVWRGRVGTVEQPAREHPKKAGVEVGVLFDDAGRFVWCWLDEVQPLDVVSKLAELTWLKVGETVRHKDRGDRGVVTQIQGGHAYACVWWLDKTDDPLETLMRVSETTEWIPTAELERAA